MTSIDDIKKLRDETSVSVSVCKQALEEAGGDYSQALEIIKSKGSLAASNKSDRKLGAGVVTSYIHNTKTIGSMLMFCSESDFVAKNEDFKTLAYDLAMHVCATNPADIETLLAEQFIKDGGKTVRQLIEGAVQKFGERVEVSRFVRFQIGT